MEVESSQEVEEKQEQGEGGRAMEIEGESSANQKSEEVASLAAAAEGEGVVQSALSTEEKGKEKTEKRGVEEMMSGGEILCEEGRFALRQVPIMPEKKIKELRPVADDSGYQRRKQRNKRKWEWVKFRNQARKDELELMHWQKSGLEVVEYPYAAFNTRLERIEYTNEQYERYLQDPLWTMADTDHLMELCYQLDLRWPVIVDRYLPVPSRPLEQLQARYFYVAHTLAERGLLRHKEKMLPGSVRRANDDDPAIGISARTRDFDASYEEKRRRQLHAAFCRTKDEEAEEKALRDELKQIELESKKLKKSTRALAQAAAEQRRLDHVAARVAKTSSTKPNLQPAQADPTLPASQQDQAQKMPRQAGKQETISKKQIQAQAQAATQRARVANFGQANNNRAPNQQQQQRPPLGLPAGNEILAHRRPVPGQPFLQSARLRLPEAQPGGLSRGMLHKLSLVLAELQVPNRPLPTKLACDAYDQLRRDIVTLLSLQKLANNKHTELTKLRAQLDDPRRHAQPPPPPAAAPTAAPTAAPRAPPANGAAANRNAGGSQQPRPPKANLPGKKAGEKQVKPSGAQKRKHKDIAAPAAAPSSAPVPDITAPLPPQSPGSAPGPPRAQKRARKQQVKHDA